MKSIYKLDADILRCMTKDELLDLLELYKSKNDRYHYMSIYNHCRWMDQLEKCNKMHDDRYRPLRKTFYTHRSGNLKTNGTYISLQWDKMLSIQFHTLQESLHELKECIVKTKLIDWNSGPLLTAIHISCADEIVKLITETLGGVFNFEIPCTCFFLPQSSAFKIQVPSISEGYKIRSLDENHADYIHANWPHNDEASVDFIRGMIKFNTTLGVFRLRDDELIAWIFQNEFFGIGILQVIPEEQGKGFAKLLTQTMIMRIAMSDEIDIITSFAVVDNVKSEGILTKIGFTRDCVTKWVQFKKFDGYSDMSI